MDVLDDEVPTLTVSIADESIPENGGTTVVTVTRNTDPAFAESVDISSDDPSGTDLPATVDFAAGGNRSLRQPGSG